MVSKRAAVRRILVTAGACAGLIGAGGIMVWAIGRGLYGTTSFSGLVAFWLMALLLRRVHATNYMDGAQADGDDREEELVLLRVLLDRSPAALLAVEGSRVRALNRAARSLFATDDLILPPPPALLSNDTGRLEHDGRSWRIDRAEVQVAAAPRVLIALIDVEAGEHAAEARATRNLLRVLGHEVMNAMAPITSLADTALAVMARTERDERLLSDVLGTLARRADGLRRFTEAYRQFARLPEPALAPVPIADLFVDLVRLFDARWQGAARLVVEHPGPAVASFDRDQIAQAVLALLHNAVEASKATDPSPTVQLTATVTTDRLAFHVRDHGPGIDPAHRASIFLPFFTTKEDGSGIGLTAARQIALSHGGDVSLRDPPPTTFDLSLPI